MNEAYPKIDDTNRWVAVDEDRTITLFDDGELYIDHNYDNSARVRIAPEIMRKIVRWYLEDHPSER